MTEISLSVATCSAPLNAMPRFVSLINRPLGETSEPDRSRQWARASSADSVSQTHLTNQSLIRDRTTGFLRPDFDLGVVSKTSVCGTREKRMFPGGFLYLNPYRIRMYVKPS